MNIGIIGAGNIGMNLARHLVKAGYEVAISNSRGPESLQQEIKELGEKARALTVEEAAAFGQVIFLAVPWNSPEALPSADSVKSKIVVDAMNQYGPGYSIIDTGPLTSSEVVAERLPGATIVKAFNTIYYKDLVSQADVAKPLEQRRVIFLASDNEAAKKTVGEIVEAIGFGPLDIGRLKDTRRVEPNGEWYNAFSTLDEARKQLS